MIILLKSSCLIFFSRDAYGENVSYETHALSFNILSHTVILNENFILIYQSKIPLLNWFISQNPGNDLTDEQVEKTI